MTESPEDSYLTCKIDDTQFVFQTAPSSPEAFINLENLDEDSASLSPGAEAEFAPESLEEEEDVKLPLVCLNGQFYAIRDGQLQEVDIDRQPEEDVARRSTGSPQHQEAAENHLSEDPPASTKQPKSEGDSDYEYDEDLFLEDSEEEPVDLEEEHADFLEVVTAFKCKICPYTTQDRSQLLQHFQKTHTNTSSSEPMEIDDVKLIYMCGECSNCFSSMEICRQHMINDHHLTDNFSECSGGKVKEFEGDLNGGESRRSQLSKMMQLKEKNIGCKYRGCLHKFTSYEAMQAHAACHVDPESNSYKCSICDAKFPKWKMCQGHLWKKHSVDVDILSCPFCEYKTVTMMKLSAHVRVHSDDRDYECSECGKRFKQASQLRNHKIMHMDRKNGEIPRWYTSKTCELCGKIYADAKCLKAHMQAVHSKLRPYVCNICGHSSSRKANLQMHLRQHTGDKPYNCDICEFKTGDHNSLRRHIMRHTGYRPYKCPHCSYSAIQSNSYKNHLKKKHPQSSGLFACELCSFRTINGDTYLEHLGDHEKGIIKSSVQREQEKDTSNVEVFPGNIAAAQLIYSCLGAFSSVGNTIEASLMSSSTSADGTSQTITIQIPSKHLEGSLPMPDNTKDASAIEQEDDETMHCFLRIPREEEENIDTGGITIPADLEDSEPHILNVES